MLNNLGIALFAILGILFVSALVACRSDESCSSGMSAFTRG